MAKGVGLLVAAALVAGCPSKRSGHGTNTEDAVDMSETRNRVEEAAPEGASVGVGVFETVSVPGFDLYWVDVPGPDAPEPLGYAAAVAIESGAVLRGRAAVEELVAAGARDPRELAIISLWFLRSGGGELVQGAESEAESRAGVAPPRRDADRVVYWFRTYGVSDVELFEARFDLESIELATEKVELLPAGAADRIDKLISVNLASNSASVRHNAIGSLARACPDPRAVRALAETAEEHAVEATRAEAVQALSRCQSPEAAAALIRILRSDAGSELRSLAAAGLRRFGGEDTRADVVPALREASDDPDAAVARAASRALSDLE